MEENPGPKAGLVRRVAGQVAPVFNESAPRSERVAAAAKGTVGIVGLIGGTVGTVDGISFLSTTPMVSDALHAAGPYLLLGGLDTAVPTVGVLGGMVGLVGAMSGFRRREANGLASFYRRVAVGGAVLSAGLAISALGSDLAGVGELGHVLTGIATATAGVTIGTGVSARLWRAGQPLPQRRAPAQLGE